MSNSLDKFKLYYELHEDAPDILKRIRQYKAKMKKRKMQKGAIDDNFRTNS